MHHVLNDNNVSSFIQKQSVAKLLPTRHVINVFPKLKLLDILTTFTTLAVYLTKSFTANKIYLHTARSGFEPEIPATVSCLYDSNFINITTTFAEWVLKFR
jgi:hypothetical protein